MMPKQRCRIPKTLKKNYPRDHQSIERPEKPSPDINQIFNPSESPKPIKHYKLVLRCDKNLMDNHQQVNLGLKSNLILGRARRAGGTRRSGVARRRGVDSGTLAVVVVGGAIGVAIVITTVAGVKRIVSLLKTA